MISNECITSHHTNTTATAGIMVCSTGLLALVVVMAAATVVSTGASIAAPGTMNMSLYHIIPRNYTGITDKNTVRTCRPLKICLLSGVCRALASC